MTEFTPVPGIAYDTCRFPNLNGNYAVCCLWEPIDRAVKAHPSAYMVGPCYSEHGVDLMIRTLQANPQIHFLVVRGPNLSKTSELIERALWSEAKITGLVTGLGWGTPFGAPAPRERSGDDICFVLNDERMTEIRPVSLNFSSAPRPGRGLPAQRIAGETLWDVWPRVVGEIIKCGDESPTSYGYPQLELLALSWTFAAQATIDNGPPSWLNDEFPDPDDEIFGDRVDRYAKQHMLGIGRPDGVEYVYHDRLTGGGDDQVARVIELLSANPDQRRGWLSTWERGRRKTADVLYYSCDIATKSPPCLTGLWFRQDSDGSLFTYAVFRSHDIYRAGLNNAYGICRLAQVVATALDWPLGDVVINSLSAHIYATNWDAARRVATTWGRNVVEQELGRAILRIRTEDGLIVVERLEASGQVVEALSAIVPERLEASVLRAGWVTTPSHAAWLGREIARAEARLKESNA